MTSRAARPSVGTSSSSACRPPRAARGSAARRRRARAALDPAQPGGQHTLQHLAQAAAGQRVVADVRDAVGRQHAGAQREQRVADRLGHPGVHAVRDDVVERLRGGLVRLDADRVEGHVAEPQPLGQLTRTGDRDGRVVDPDERRAGQRGRHRQQVAPDAAAELEHAAARGRRGGQPEQRRERRQPIRMGLHERPGRILQDVVARRVAAGRHAAMVDGYSGSRTRARLAKSLLQPSSWPRTPPRPTARCARSGRW